MRRALSLLICLSLICLLAFATPLRAQDRVNVVASFSILGDFVRNVGGDRISLTTLVGTNADVHVYTPSPADAKRINAAAARWQWAFSVVPPGRRISPKSAIA